MAKLIIKNPYIQCGGSQGADGYMKYIATRPRAERLGGMVCLVMRTAWTWQRPWKNWTTTLERYGRTSSP